MHIPLRSFERLGSTAIFAQGLIEQGEEAPFAIQALEQSQGIGQRGKAWSSPRGSVYLSIVLPNSAKELKARGLIPIKAACVTVNWIAEHLGVWPQIKWPNDLYFAGSKLGGILCQSSLRADTWGPLSIGIGINVGRAPRISNEHYSSISINEMVGRDFDIKCLGKSLVEFFASNWFALGDEDVRRLYASFAAKPFSLWHEPCEPKPRIYRELELDRDGCLLVQDLAKPSPQGQRKLASANHGLSSVFLSRFPAPVPVVFCLGKAIRVSLFAGRERTRPQIQGSFDVGAGLEGFQALMVQMRQVIGDFSSHYLSCAYPVCSDGLSSSWHKPFCEAFKAHGFTLLEVPLKLRLSLELPQGPHRTIRAAAIESLLETRRLLKQTCGASMILDWSELFGFADYIDQDGRPLGCLTPDALARIKQESCLSMGPWPTVIGTHELAQLVGHGLMLLALA